MKRLWLVVLVFVLAGCATIQKGPAMYDNATFSVASDSVLLLPPSIDKDFVRILTTRLGESAKAEIASQGNLKVVPICAPRTLKVVQEITGITINTVTDVSGSFFVVQIFKPGTGDTTKSDEIYLDTTTSIADCESGKVLGTYNHRGWGQNPIDLLQDTASFSAYQTYIHQHAPK